MNSAQVMNVGWTHERITWDKIQVYHRLSLLMLVVNPLLDVLRP